jgi:hypothetical protein
MYLIMFLAAVSAQAAEVSYFPVPEGDHRTGEYLDNKKPGTYFSAVGSRRPKSMVLP